MHGIDHRPTACCSFSDFKFHRNLRDLTSGFLYRNYALTFAALMKCRTIELTHHFAMVCSDFHSSIYITPNRLPNPRKKADTIFVDVVKKTKCQILFLAFFSMENRNLAKTHHMKHTNRLSNMEIETENVVQITRTK